MTATKIFFDGQNYHYLLENGDTLISKDGARYALRMEGKI